MDPTRKKILVFGGAKGMGLCIADFLARCGNEITIADIDKETPKIAAARKFEFVVLPDGKKYLEPLLANGYYFDYDVAVIAVPIDITPDIIRQVGPHLKKDSLLMDVTSVKTPAMEAMDDAAGTGVSVLGTHPMFGTDDSSVFGQTCVVVPSKKRPSDRWLAWWVQLLKQEGAVHVQSTAEEHDKMMLAVQVLLHYVLICFGSALPKIGVDLNRAYSFRSPMYEITTGLISRILTQSPDTYYWIQQQSGGEMVRNLLLQCSTEISGTFKKTLPQYNKLRLDIREAIGETNVAAYSSVAAAIIRDRAKQKKALLEAEGKMGCIENVENVKKKRIHYCYVKNIAPDIVTIEELNKKGEKKKGEIKISLKKARLLSPEETNEWKLRNLPLKNLSLSFQVTKEANPQVIASLASNRFSVARVSVIDIYPGPETTTEKKKVTLGISVIANQEGEAAYSEIRRLIEGIGCILL